MKRLDPKSVVDLVNAKLRTVYPGRQLLDGPVFTAVVESIIEVLNETLEPLMNPVFTLRADVDDVKFQRMIEQHNSFVTRRAQLLDADGWASMPASYTSEKALTDALKAEPRAMQEWPTPKGPLTTSCAYRCTDRGCPPRAPISSQIAPTCYTCGKLMVKS